MIRQWKRPEINTGYIQCTRTYVRLMHVLGIINGGDIVYVGQLISTQEHT